MRIALSVRDDETNCDLIQRPLIMPDLRFQFQLISRAKGKRFAFHNHQIKSEFVGKINFFESRSELCTQ